MKTPDKPGFFAHTVSYYLPKLDVAGSTRDHEKKGRNFSESASRVMGARDALDRKNEFPFLEELLCIPILKELR
jgi:hypothetical protein